MSEIVRVGGVGFIKQDLDNGRSVLIRAQESEMDSRELAERVKYGDGIGESVYKKFEQLPGWSSNSNRAYYHRPEGYQRLAVERRSRWRGKKPYVLRMAVDIQNVSLWRLLFGLEIVAEFDDLEEAYDYVQRLMQELE